MIRGHGDSQVLIASLKVVIGDLSENLSESDPVPTLDSESGDDAEASCASWMRHARRIAAYTRL